MKMFFYIWCAMAITAFIALFFNPSHIVTLVISLLFVYASYPEYKEEKKGKEYGKRLR